ncbi:MAG: helix-turn-helix transcriptional regulator [Legionella sp.]|nr:MAG: helix-turn-helix transcriptional regulator [Legionella sp.]
MNRLYIDQLPLPAYQNLDIPIFVKDKNSQYLWGNDFFIQKSLGFQGIRDIYKKEDHDFSWSDFADNLILNDKLLLQNEQTISVNERIIRHDGTAISAVTKKCPLFDHHHKIIGLIGFSLEIPKTTDLLTLSKREYAAILFLSKGFTDKQIAKKWGISPRTVESHIMNAKRKMGVNTRAELIAQFNRNHP